jgi:hypothetical protein
MKSKIDIESNTPIAFCVQKLSFLDEAVSKIDEKYQTSLCIAAQVPKQNSLFVLILLLVYTVLIWLRSHQWFRIYRVVAVGWMVFDVMLVIELPISVSLKNRFPQVGILCDFLSILKIGE